MAACTAARSHGPLRSPSPFASSACNSCKAGIAPVPVRVYSTAPQYGHVGVRDVSHQPQALEPSRRADYTPSGRPKLCTRQFRLTMALVSFYLQRLEGCSREAMERAARNGHLEVVKLLHEIGATCTSTALHLAQVHGHHDVYRFLNTMYPGKVSFAT